MAEQKMWKVGIIGAGKHGSRYARHIINDVEGLELQAVSRRSLAGKEQAQRWHCQWYADWQDLVRAPDVDCVITALPPVLNMVVAMACAQERKPLLLEKPMAVSIGEAETILEQFAKHGLPLTIGQTLRYNQVVQALRQQMRSVGKLCSFSANQRLEPATLAWLDDPATAGTGVSFHTAIHVFDALRYITGMEIRRVQTEMRCHRTSRLEDHLIGLLELHGGILGTVDCSKVGSARSGRFEFIGEQAQLHGDQVHNSCERIEGVNRQRIDPGPAQGTIVPLLRDWLAFLRGERENPIPGEEGLAAVRVSAACLRSAFQGGWQEV